MTTFGFEFEDDDADDDDDDQESLAGSRGGETFSPALDTARLNKQHVRVWSVVYGGGWFPLHTISAYTNDPEASVSARLRDFRKPEYGSHTLERRRVKGAGLYVYRLTWNDEYPKPTASQVEAAWEGR